MKKFAFALLLLLSAVGAAFAQVTNYPNISGNTPTNATTATALAATPAQCSSNQYASGITATGNANCNALASGDLTAALTTPPAIGGTAPAAVHATTLTSQPTSAPTRDAGNVGYTLAQSAIPMLLVPSGYMANNGLYIVGQAPSASATASFSATSGTGVTMTMSAATLLGTSADVGRVLTILDTTYKYATITTQSSTTVATVTLSGGTLSGTGPFANSAIWLSGSPSATANTTAFSVPIPTIATNLYGYLPAGALATSSAAGVYFGQWQSTTVIQFYNNAYASGTPIVPGTPTAFATTGPGAFTQTTGSAITLISATIGGNVVGVNGGLDVRWKTLQNNSSGAKTSQFYYGSGLVAQVAPTTEVSVGVMAQMTNKGVMGQQDNWDFQTAPTTSAINLGGQGGIAIDSTSSQAATLQLTLATATDYVGFYNYSIKVFPN